MATPTYTDYSGVPTTSTFDPTQANAFYSNPNDLSVNYGTGTTQTEQQFNDLLAAYNYLMDPANQAALDQSNYAGYSQYVLGQLQTDLAEQQNVANYNQGQGTATSTADAYQAANTAYTNAMNTSSAEDFLTYANQIGGGAATAVQQVYNYVKSLPAFAQGTISGAQLIGMMQNALKQSAPAQLNALQTANLNANSALNPLGAAVTNNFALNSPDYQHAQQMLQNYYGIDANGNPIAGDKTGQVQLANQAADQDLYQVAYNLKNQINQKATQLGVGSSGQRQQALGGVNQQVINQQAQRYQQSAQDALNNIDSYNQNVQNEQAQQNSLVNNVKQGQISNLFNNSTQQQINAYNNQANTQNQTNLQNAQSQIQQQAANTDFLNSLFGAGGQALGGIAGTATGGLI